MTTAPIEPASPAPEAISLPSVAELLPRRVPRMHELVIAAVLCGATVVTVLMLTRAPQPPAASNAKETGAIDFQMPTAQAMTLQGLASQSMHATQTASKNSEPSIRIVDLPSSTTDSCEDSIWPYIEQHCLTVAKDEPKGKAHAQDVPKIAAKIGPRPIDSRAPDSFGNAADPSIPIGSMTAIAPARPRGSTTDGVASEARQGPIAEAPPEFTMKARRSMRGYDANTANVERAGITAKKQKEYRRVAQVRRKTYRQAVNRETTAPAPFFFGFLTPSR